MCNFLCKRKGFISFLLFEQSPLLPLNNLGASLLFTWKYKSGHLQIEEWLLRSTDTSRRRGWGLWVSASVLAKSISHQAGRAGNPYMMPRVHTVAWAGCQSSGEASDYPTHPWKELLEQCFMSKMEIKRKLWFAL